MDIEVDKALLERSTKKKRERSALRDRVARLLASDCSRTEIMQRLGISSGFYYRLVKEIRGEVKCGTRSVLSLMEG
jgi:hypothetical protein